LKVLKVHIIKINADPDHQHRTNPDPEKKF